MPLLTSAPSATATATLSAVSFWLKCPEDPALNTTIRAADWAPRRQRPSATVVVEGEDRVVVLRGKPLGHVGTLRARTHAEEEYDALGEILNAEKTLLLQNVLGQQWYVEVTGDIDARQIRAEPTPDEPWPVRHFHEWSVQLTEVAVP